MDSISKKYGDYKYFSFLEEKDLDKLKDISIKKTYKKDEILFYKGDESKYLHLLVSGIVKLYTHDFKDNEVVIHLTFSKKSKNQILHSTNPFIKGF